LEVALESHTDITTSWMLENHRNLAKHELNIPPKTLIYKKRRKLSDLKVIFLYIKTQRRCCCFNFRDYLASRMFGSESRFPFNKPLVAKGKESLLGLWLWNSKITTHPRRWSQLVKLWHIKKHTLGDNSHLIFAWQLFHKIDISEQSWNIN